VGKTPLKETFSHFYKDLYDHLVPFILYNSRKKRPGESEGTHYFFRSLKEIKELNKNPDFIVFKVHNDYQAIDKNNLHELLKNNDVIFEGNTTVGRLFQTHPALVGINKLSIFLSPLSGKEIVELSLRGKKIFKETIIKIMRQKILYRQQKHGTDLDPMEVADLNKRADDSYHELKEAIHFDYIIPNHDGEDSENWHRSLLPSGDAGRALDAFAAILTGKNHPNIEKWEENLVP
jgi:guanylate kinase